MYIPHYEYTTLQYEYFTGFGQQYDKKFIIMLIKTKNPVHIMVFRMVASDGDVMSPFIFPHSLRLNTEAYIKCLEYVVWP